MNQASAFVDTAPETLDRVPHRARHLGLRLTKTLAASAVLQAVALRYGETVERLKGKRRTMHLSHARHVAAWLMRQSRMSYPEIGEALGGRDHTTAMNSIKVVEAELEREPGGRESLERMLPTETMKTVRLVAGEGAVFEDYETATGSTAGDVSSSASSARSQDDGSRA